MEKSIVIHQSKYGHGGLGDFIRAGLTLYSFCKRENISYYIDFSENPKLSKCFHSLDIPNQIKSLPSENIELMGGISYKNQVIDKLNKILYFPKVYYVNANIIGYEDTENISNIRKEFFDIILNPKQIIKDNLNKIYQELNLSPYSYISYHIRCGDFNINGFKQSKRCYSNHYDSYLRDGNIRIDLRNKDVYKK